MKKRVNASIYIFSPESPRLFFFLPYSNSPPFPLTTPQRGATVHLFQFKSAFKYLLNELTSFWSSFDIELFIHYLSFFVISLFSICWIAKSRIFLTSTSHIVFLSSSCSSICWMKFWARMLEKNTRTTLILHQRPSCLVLFDSGAFSFFQSQACYLFFF